MKKKSPDTLTVLDFGVLPNHPRLTVPVTLFKGTSAEPFQCITLGNLLSEIETTDINKLKDSQSMVCLYEAYLQNGDKAQKAAYDKKKVTLNGFLMGNFSKRGDAKSNCVEYVPCLVFDLDGCKSTYDCFLYHTQLQELDFVFATFPSPSGYGLRILVWTTATYETHRIVYQQILAALCAHLNITTDRNDGIHFT
jgi:VirE N-terminal domain